MTDDEVDDIATRVQREPRYTAEWKLWTIHAARLDRHALLREVRRLRRLEREYAR